MIVGTHLIVYSTRCIGRSVRGGMSWGLQASTRARGWLIFTLPPAEVAVHPADVTDRCELYL